MMISRTSALFALLLAAGTHAINTQAKLHLLSDPKARCLDGTQSGYYYLPSQASENSTKWIIHLQGGGECVSEDRCKGATTNSLGSSKYWGSSMTPGFLNTPDESNELWTWNHVHVGYCSQDLHSGQRTMPSNETYGLYFSGRLSFLAILDDLTDAYGLDNASDIILSGDSAGGLGVWYHLDYLAKQYPSARVVGAPIAGFYFYAYPYYGPDHTNGGLAPFEPYAWEGHFDLWQSYVDLSCYEANKPSPWVCMLANQSYPFISSPVFVTESQTDKVVLFYHDNIPPLHVSDAPEQAYLKQWHANMTVALSPVLASSDGVFNAACLIHTEFSGSAPLIQGSSYWDAFGNWFFHRPGPTQLVDDCGIMCNPTCPK